MNVWIAVILSALLGPGMGQLYNREYKKGAYLVILSLIVFLAAMAWLRGALAPFIPLDLTTADPVALKGMIENGLKEVLGQRGAVFYTYQFLLFGLWIYSVVDAYRGAQKRKKSSPEGTPA